MLLGDILSGAAFRAVLRAAVAFVVILAIMSALALRLIDDAMVRNIRLGVEELEGALSETYAAEGPLTLRGEINALTGSVTGTAFAHALYDGDGGWIAGNVDVRLPAGRWERRGLIPLGAQGPTAQTYLLHAVALGEWTLVTGSSLASVRQAQTSALRGLAITGFLVVLSMLAAGFVLSRRSQVKLERIEATLDRVSQGEIGARIGAGEADGQIDRISRRIDGHLGQLETLMASTRRTAAAVAHDLRRPLSRARLQLERALKNAEAGADTREELEASISEIDRLAGIISTILRISRIEAGATGDVRGGFDLAELIDELAETYEEVAEDAGQRLTRAVAVRPLPLRGDREMVAQLIVNLVQNAISHAGAGAEITIRGRVHPDGAVTLSVADTGVGIAAGEIEDALQPFYRVDAARTDEGSGLGLALVRAIAERHGARLSLRDNGPGLVVEAVFPPG